MLLFLLQAFNASVQDLHSGIYLYSLPFVYDIHLYALSNVGELDGNNVGYWVGDCVFVLIVKFSNIIKIQAIDMFVGSLSLKFKLNTHN